MSLLQVRNLVVEFPNRRGTLRALDDISFDIAPGEILGVVGESGAGKSLTGASIIGLLEPPGRIASGQILLQGERIDNLPYEAMRKVRGRKIGAIFQDPLTSLNPLYSVGRQLIVADEPTTALDVSIQAQIITLLKTICKQRGAAVMLITHDMGVIAETCDRVAVMYAGRVAEIGPVHEVINHPAHPYTAGLMACIPDMSEDRERLHQIDGAMPRLNAIPSGCAYNPRCERVFDRCYVERPDLLPAGATQAACWLHAREKAVAV
ncbi:MAG: ABC transporter ATP-binding protein [Rubrivivax sp.]|nr:MAG: ABC transporter ATP-binding protein [Rubrivivax sp.]